MHQSSFLSRLGRLLFCLLCGLGVLAGGILLLCAGGVLDLSLIQPVQETAAPVDISVPEEPEAPFRAVFLPLDELDEPTLPAHCDGVVVPMKTAEGTLGYVSNLELAADCGASSGDPARNLALRRLNSMPGLHTVALVSCLRDDCLTAYDETLALQRVSGSPWRDPSGTGWLDPGQIPVQDYLSGICWELANLGFDEILLTDCAYPTQGDLDCLREEGKSGEILETFCRRLQGTMAGYSVQLSVVGERDSVTPHAPSGQTAALLASFPGRVWSLPEDEVVLSAFSPILLPEEENSISAK